MTAAEMLAAWHWQGPLGETLVLTYQPVHHVQVPIDDMINAARMKPSDVYWQTGVFLHVVVEIRWPEPHRRSHTFSVPESADLQAVAKHVMIVAVGLVLVTLTSDVRMTFAAGPDAPARNFFDTARLQPLDVLGLNTLGWTGP